MREFEVRGAEIRFGIEIRLGMNRRELSPCGGSLGARVLVVSAINTLAVIWISSEFGMLRSGM